MAKIKITLRKSKIGAPERQVKNLKALGLGKINSSVIHEDNPVIMGMVRKVKHLVEVETVK